MAGRGATWHENQLVPITRHGRREDVYWTYSYSPIDEPTAPNGVGGVLVICVETTETVLSERRFAEQTQHLRAMFQQAPSFIALLRGPDHVFELVNDAYARLIGEREVVGQSVREALPEVAGQGFFEILDQVYESAEPFTARRAAVTLASGPDGSLQDRFLDFVYQPVRDASGEVTGILAEGSDVTDHVLLEEALQASEARFQAIVDSIDQMVWSTTPEGFHDFYNQRWYDFTGMPEGSTDGEAWNGMFHPEDQARAWAVWRSALETGETYHIEYRLRHASGQYRWVLGRAQPVLNDAGRITRWFGTCTDIEDIVEARQILTRSRDDLEREIDARTRERDRIWRNARDLLAVFSFDGIVQEANPAWTEILGWAPEDVIGKHHLHLVHPDDHAGSAKALETATQGPLPSFESRLRHRDGTYRWISWVGSPDAERVYATGQAPSGEIADPPGRGRVLVVEDNADVGEFSSRLLEDLGYSPTFAATAHDALKLLETTPDRFDVVFSDVVMPGMDGVTLGREVRRLYPGLAFVLTSGYSHILAKEGSHGFDLLQKPYSVESLSRILRRALQQGGAVGETGEG